MWMVIETDCRVAAAADEQPRLRWRCRHKLAE
jgi:hypothetical protein